jgi:dolichol-phosphate mannosyltransferase
MESETPERIACHRTSHRDESGKGNLLMKRSTFSYDIHGIITVLSDVALPELKAFTVSALAQKPTIRVRLGKVDADAGPGNDDRTVTYIESAGQRGFAINIRLGDFIDVVASPFLRRSPHVLYTNVVEPILRWAFVERGYALVHGACMAIGDNAFLITARTDTGKTTTVLKTLDANPDYFFISDDLTLLKDDGTILPYPKPLTISRHTLSAVHTPLLTPLERFTLIFQSRLHSKSGRWFGLMLTRFNLPMATTNAIVQWLVPPPKYHIQRLVPHARIKPQAKLAGMVVIERGDSRHIDLNHDEAVDMLLSNCDDAYGFPPYADIKETLYMVGKRDLRDEERRIVATAMLQSPSMVMRSETRNWFQMLPDFFNRVAAPPQLIPQGIRLEGVAD